MSHLFICFNTIWHKKSRTWSKMHFKGSKQQVIWELSNTSQGHNTKSFSLFFRCKKKKKLLHWYTNAKRPQLDTVILTYIFFWRLQKLSGFKSVHTHLLVARRCRVISLCGERCFCFIKRLSVCPLKCHWAVIRATLTHVSVRRRGRSSGCGGEQKTSTRQKR